ncbi:MAG: hypothetical protein KAJ19_09275, partial [Gammaproteobacteria bacterium]|nr:hypothetical protein [Gammaproteobacteria bacterium]
KKFCFYKKPVADAGGDVAIDEGTLHQFNASKSTGGTYQCGISGGGGGSGMNPEVLYYDFEGVSGTTVTDKSSLGGNNGVMYGNQYLTSDAKHGSWAYRSPVGAVSDRLQVTGPTTNFDMNGGFTFMTWVKINSAGYQGLMSFGNCCTLRNGYTMNLYSNGQIRFWGGVDANNNNYNSFSSTMSSNTWHHVAIKAEGGFIKTYIDGVFSTQLSYVPPTSPSKAVGTHITPYYPVVASDCISYANGGDITMDDVAIFNRALTDAEIQVAMTGLGGAGDPDVSAKKENFESGAPGWTAGAIASPPHGWSIVSAAASGSPTFLSKTYGTNGNYQNDYEHSYLMSPEISVGDTPVNLKFESWNYDEGYLYDREYVEISKNNGVTWTNLAAAPYQQLHNYADGTWRTITFPPSVMNTYANEDVKIRFRYDTVDPLGSWEKGWYIDDFELNFTGVQQNLTYRWNMGDGSGWTNWTGNPLINHSYPDGEKTYNVTLQFTDGKYNATDVISVRVKNAPPEMNLTSGQTLPSPTYEGNWVTFKDFTFSDPAGDLDLPFKYEWDFDMDGNIDAQGNITSGVNEVYTIPTHSHLFMDDAENVWITLRDKDDGKIKYAGTPDEVYVAS